MQQVEAPIVFVCIHGQLVRNRRHEGRTVLTNTVKVDFDAAKLKMKHRRNPLDTLDHAGCDGRKKQFGGIEGVWPALNIGIKPDLRVLAAGQASVRICALRHDVIFEHLRNPGFDPPGSAMHDSNAGGVIRCDGSIDGSNNRPASMLLYAKGGFAWTNDQTDVVDPVAGGIVDGTGRVGRDGYTLGAGLEYMFAPGWSAKVEYDYYNFGATTLSGNTPAGVFVEPITLTNYSVNSVKAGINYHFNSGYPGLPRY